MTFIVDLYQRDILASIFNRSKQFILKSSANCKYIRVPTYIIAKDRADPCMVFAYERRLESII